MRVLCLLDPHEGLAPLDGSRPDGKPLFGAWLAIDGWLRALVRHGDVEVVHFAASPRDLDAMTAAVGRLPRGRAAVDVLDVRRVPALLRERRDLVVHHPGQLAPARLWQLRAGAGAPWTPITTAHHTLSYASVAGNLALALGAGPRPHDAIISSSSAASTAIDAMFARYRLPDWPGERVVIPLGVDTDAFTPGGRAEARRALDVPSGAFVCAWVGRFSPVDKADLSPLVEAFRLLRERTSGDVCFLFAGADDYRYATTLRELLERAGLTDRSSLLPDADPADVRRVYAAADVFTSPADNVQEAFGLTVLEAMASGVPVVASDWNGYRDTVTEDVGVRVPTLWAGPDGAAWAPDGTYGWRFDHLACAQAVAVDVAALADTLVRLCHEPERRAALAAGARRRAADHYDWRVVIERHVELWRELVKRAGADPHPAETSASALREVFGHYASARLEEASLLCAGLRDPADIRWLHQRYDLTELLPVEAAEAVFAAVVAAGAAPVPLRNLAAPTGLDGARLATVVGWLVKHGFLAVGSPSAAAALPAPDGAPPRW